MTTAPDSAALASLLEDFRQREQVGIAKYGVTVDRTDLTHVQWLQHALEESMDNCLYLKRAIETAKHAEHLLAKAEALLRQTPPICNDIYHKRSYKVSFGKQAKALAKEIKAFRGIA